MFKTFIVSLFIITQSWAGPAPLKNNHIDIIGGSAAVANDWKFTVSVQYMGQHWCGGVLINPQWVLTAAHCMAIGQMSVLVGTPKSSSQHGQLIKIVEKIKHPDYKSEGLFDHDFALVKLETPSEGEVVTLNEEEITPQFPDVMPMFDVAGWGVTENSTNAAEGLLSVQVPLVAKDVCAEAYGDRLTETMFCAGYAEGLKDACQGDSGGPLVLNKDGKKVLYGLVSWGDGCAEAGKYGVYADVSKVKDWIKKTTTAEKELPTGEAVK